MIFEFSDDKFHVLEVFQIKSGTMWRRWRSFVAGAAVGGIVVGISAFAISHFTTKADTDSSITNENDNDADDDCLSLFYHNHVPEDGSGIPEVGACTEEEVAKLKVVQSDYRKLPIEFYQRAVEMLPIL